MNNELTKEQKLEFIDYAIKILKANRFNFKCIGLCILFSNFMWNKANLSNLSIYLRFTELDKLLEKKDKFYEGSYIWAPWRRQPRIKLLNKLKKELTK